VWRHKLHTPVPCFYLLTSDTRSFHFSNICTCDHARLNTQHMITRGHFWNHTRSAHMVFCPYVCDGKCSQAMPASEHHLGPGSGYGYYSILTTTRYAPTFTTSQYTYNDQHASVDPGPLLALLTPHTCVCISNRRNWWAFLFLTGQVRT